MINGTMGGTGPESDASYFTWENLHELASLDHHTSFAGELIGKYRWPDAVHKDLSGRLAEIRKKQQDKNLNLSVIGEFSSGKSTFINALLRTDLLAAGVLQGTTVASSVIEYGPEYAITRNDREGTGRTMRFDTFEQFRSQLNRIAANNDAAEGMGEVTACLPSESLRDGKYRIIDTPGLNATVQWHADAAIRTIRQTSDLSIILVDAVRPLPDDLCRFIGEYLEPVLGQCIFVVTKIDLIAPRERTMLLRYVQRAVKAKFGIQQPLVLPYSSADVINGFAPGTFGQGKYPSDIGVSLESEKQILGHMARQRAIAQTKKLISLIDLIYESISGQMRHMTDAYERRLRLLLETRQADLSDFIAEQKVHCSRAYLQEAARLREQVAAAGDVYATHACGAILGNIDAQLTTDNLNGYMHGQIRTDCMNHANALCRRIGQDVLRDGRFSAAADRILWEFRAAFQQQFRRLECLVPEAQVMTIMPAQIEMPDVRAIDLAGAYTEDMVRQENRWAGGGAAAGALAGTAIAPGIGTILGAAIGFIGGLAGADKSGINVTEMKTNSKQKLWQPIKTYFNEAAMQACSGVDAYIESVRRQIVTEIDRYLEAYRATVDQWIREEQANKILLERKVKEIQSDMHQIDVRRQGLESLRKQIQPRQEETQ